MPKKRQAGFTLVEILIAFAIIAILAAMVLVNLGRPQTAASLSGTVDTLLADIKSEQQLAMTGDDGGTSNQQPHGILFSSDHYTLFAGATYNGSDSNNFTVTPSGTVSITTTLAGSELQFAKSSGEVEGFDPSNDTVTVTVGDQSTVITINRYGTVTTD